MLTKNVKVGEMDTLIPEFLGLSQALLNYVNFCHQEDCLWPFSDSGKLKSVLDQVFSTNVLSGALEAQKKYISKEEANLRGKQKELNWAMDMLEKNRNTIEKHKSVVKEIKGLKEEQEAIKSQLEHIQELKLDLERKFGLTQAKNTLENELTHLRSTLTEYSEEYFCLLYTSDAADE